MIFNLKKKINQLLNTLIEIRVQFFCVIFNHFETVLNTKPHHFESPILIISSKFRTDEYANVPQMMDEID